MDLVARPKRFEVFLVSLDPTVGSEICKVRPAVVVSPDNLNQMLNTCLAAPMTTTVKRWPFRVSVCFGGQAGQVALDQIRTLDHQRFIRKLGELTPQEGQTVLENLAHLFAP